MHSDFVRDEFYSIILISTLLSGGCESLLFFGSQQEKALALGCQLEVHECTDYVYATNEL